ncbi:uncharacterized protein LOC133904154 [Phragmites australis]|uniref:uncharacterized protein LOC133904154 n=1 Tax=Phragmites australis TaxID=29695 RepID=UPI002D76F726|nr:uncharacterized protein LOC133904154 [Phragmites australis]
MAKTAAATALDIAEISFSDLTLLLSPETPDDDDRRRRVLSTVGTELGRGESGLLAIAGVPRAGTLRWRLLPLARRLALMDHPTRVQLLNAPVHPPSQAGFGQRRASEEARSVCLLIRAAPKWVCFPEKAQSVDGFEEPKGDDNIENLGELVKELGLYMMELGILVARACNIVIRRESSTKRKSSANKVAVKPYQSCSQRSVS